MGCINGKGELDVGSDVCRAGSRDGMVFNFWSGVMDRNPMELDTPWPEWLLFVLHENAGDMLGRLPAGSGSMLPQISLSFFVEDEVPLFPSTRRSKLFLALSISGDVRSVSD